MKKILLPIIITTISFSLFAQNVGIGTASPDASAKLDVTATDKGFLPPRVNLTATNAAGPITSPATGLLVYNQATAGTAPNNVTPGYYYWDGSKWARVMENKNTGLDIGYVVGWTSSTAPPDYLLPLNGGTYNWADFPDFQTLNTSYPCTFIASSTATTFTLIDINSTGKFLRGNTSAGVNQDDATALPSTSFTTNTTGNHNHSVDPPSTSTNTAGNHNHSFYTADNDVNSSTSQGYPYNNGHYAFRTTDRRQRTENNGTIQDSGNHTHTIDIAAFNSASNGDHSHTITGGGDAETRPTNTSVVWCLKVKSTSTTANITVTNTANTAINGLSVYGSAIGLGGNLNQNTTINQINNTLTYNLNGTGDFDIQDNGTSALFVKDDGNVGINNNNPTAKLHIMVPPDNNNNPSSNGVYVYNAGNTGDNDDAIIAARVLGSGAGDPFLSLDVDGVTGWSVGLDNSDGDKLKFANSWSDPGTNTKMSITTGGVVNIANLSGTGNRPVYATSTGDLTNLGRNYRVAYLEDRSEKTQDNSNLGYRSVGGTTNNLSVYSGDIVVVNVTLKCAFTGGSGNDDIQFRINITGCASTSQTESYQLENLDNDRNEYQTVAMQFIYTATCDGDIYFQLYADNNSDADDATKYGDLVIVATKY